MWEKSVYRMYTSENNLKYDTKHVTRNNKNKSRIYKTEYKIIYTQRVNI